jgi:hypothetical protein
VVFARRGVRRAAPAQADAAERGSAENGDGRWAAIAERGNKVRLYRRSGSSWSLTQTILLAQVTVTPGIAVRGIYSGLDLTGDLLVIGDVTANVDSGGRTVSNGGPVLAVGASGSSAIHLVILGVTISGTSGDGCFVGSAEGRSSSLLALPAGFVAQPIVRFSMIQAFVTSGARSQTASAREPSARRGGVESAQHAVRFPSMHPTVC